MVLKLALYTNPGYKNVKSCKIVQEDKKMFLGQANNKILYSYDQVRVTNSYAYTIKQNLLRAVQKLFGIFQTLI